MTRSVPAPLLIGSLIAACAGVILAACLIGPAEIPAGDAIAALFGAGDARDEIIVREIRLPRALAAFFSGAALAAGGAALQGLLRNPLADPGVLGISSSAALGAVLAIYFNLSAGGPATPLAVDLATFDGQPAAVVLLPGIGGPGRVDVWVVPPDCAQGKGQFLYYANVARP